METKDRIEKAVELFKSGYNCSQSVVGAFADMYGFTEEQAFRMSASFWWWHRSYEADMRCCMRHVPIGRIGKRSCGRQGP